MRTGDIKAKHKEAKQNVKACLAALESPLCKIPAAKRVTERALAHWCEVEEDMGRRLAQRFKKNA